MLAKSWCSSDVWCMSLLSVWLINCIVVEATHSSSTITLIVLSKKKRVRMGNFTIKGWEFYDLLKKSTHPLISIVPFNAKCALIIVRVWTDMHHCSLWRLQTVERSRAFYAAFCMCITIINKSFVISRFVKRPMSVYFLLCWQAVNSFSSLLHVRCKNSFAVHSSLRSLSHTAIISIFNNSCFHKQPQQQRTADVYTLPSQHACMSASWDFSLERSRERTKVKRTITFKTHCLRLMFFNFRI